MQFRMLLIGLVAISSSVLCQTVPITVKSAMERYQIVPDLIDVAPLKLVNVMH